MTDKPEPIVDQMLAGHRQMIKQLRGVPGVTSEKMVEGNFQNSAIDSSIFRSPTDIVGRVLERSVSARDREHGPLIQNNVFFDHEKSK